VPADVVIISSMTSCISGTEKTATISANRAGVFEQEESMPTERHDVGFELECWSCHQRSAIIARPDDVSVQDGDHVHCVGCDVVAAVIVPDVCSNALTSSVTSFATTVATSLVR
jgi:hypothetical protein